MSNLILRETPLKNLKLINHLPVKDERGFLSRLFCQNTLSHLINKKTIKQINKTSTKNKGTVRGLHFQYPPFAETKIISCLKGKVWDVAVDLRKGSPTFLNYHAQILSEDNYISYLIPEGFAHGFQSLTSDCEMLYFHTEDYNKDSEGAINAIDPIIGIKWPEPINERSKRDNNHPMLTNDFIGI
jgi:dTDP-4-dehydrorhamnose 3,5-epimerase|tara:strand:+ start:16752 stop:17306 length:555 start_codon:yes stop_codon:yes gene_type:complete